MKFNFITLDNELTQGLKLLCEDYDFSLSEEGIKVNVSKGNKLNISLKNNEASIEYGEKVQFFRALGYLIENIRKDKNEFEITEVQRFDTSGPMIDLSHGAVLNMDTYKSYIRKMAIMGLNMLMLYREESYYVDGYPYFGYMRGRQNEDEIKELDDYAFSFGIEIVPAIQCLGHLSNTLRWSAFNSIADTGDCLLVGEEKTYEFIEAMIKCAMRPLRTKKVHIGFDETMSLGTGQYMRLHGHRPRIDIFMEHLNMVGQITKKYGLEPMIWADMFFRLKGSAAGYVIDNYEIPQYIADQIPEDMGLVSWGYGMSKGEVAKQQISGVINAGRKTYFAGATIDWIGFCIDYASTFRATNTSLSMAHELGIKDVIMTTWGDDSPERDYMLTLLGCQIYAEHMYSPIIDDERVKERYNFCAISNSDMVLDISDIDTIHSALEESESDELVLDEIKGHVNPSKYMLWQDPMMGLFDAEAQKVDFPSHYQKYSDKLKSYKGKVKDFDECLDFYIGLCDALKEKSMFGLKLREAYLSGNKEALKDIAQNDTSKLITLIESLWLANRDIWFKRHTAFGFEVLERRYGALIMRLKTTKERIEGYLNGKYLKLEELEEERLSPVCTDSEDICFFNDWLLTSTAWGR